MTSLSRTIGRLLAFLGWLAIVSVILSGGGPAWADAAADQEMFAAIRRGDLPGVQAAVAKGADAGALNDRGKTGADEAIDLGHFDIAHFLLSLRPATAAPGTREDGGDTTPPERRVEPAVSLPAPTAQPVAAPDAPPTGQASPVVAPAPAWPADRPNPFDPKFMAPGPGRSDPEPSATAAPAPGTTVIPPLPTRTAPPPGAAAPASAPAPAGEPSFIDRLGSFFKTSAAPTPVSAPVPASALAAPQAPTPAPVAAAPTAEPSAEAGGLLVDLFQLVAGDEPPPSSESGPATRTASLPDPESPPPRSVSVVASSASPPPPASSLPHPAATSGPNNGGLLDKLDANLAAGKEQAAEKPAPPAPAAPAAPAPAAPPTPAPVAASLPEATPAPMTEPAPPALEPAPPAAEVGPFDPGSAPPNLAAPVPLPPPAGTDAVQPVPLATTPAPTLDLGRGVPATNRAREVQTAHASGQPAPPTPERHLKGVVLPLGETMTLGRTVPYPRSDPNREKNCVARDKGYTLFCVEDVTWSDAMAPSMTVNTIMFSGRKAVARYHADQAVAYHVLFPTEGFDQVVAHYKTRLGPPSDTFKRAISPLATQRRENPSLVWRSRETGSGKIAMLEIRKFDDARGGFPDTHRGVIMLRYEDAPPVFPQLSVIELLVLRNK